MSDLFYFWLLKIILWHNRPTNYDMLQNIPALVTIEQNDFLTKLPDLEEVKQAVYELNGAYTW